MFYALGAVQVSAMPYLVILLSTLAFCILMLAGATLLDSDAEAWPVRAMQRARLRTTRMEQMLRRRNIDVGAYARGLPVAELKAQIATCRSCGLTDLCDRCLESRVPATSASFSFCPNRPAVERRLEPRVVVTA